MAVVLALLAVGCMTPPPPSLPAALHIPKDTPADERAVWEQAAATWNAKAGRDVISEVTDREDGCGIYVVRGDELTGTERSGWAQVVGPCRAEVMLRPDEIAGDMALPPEKRWRTRVAAEHELAHVLANTNEHSDDVLSVRFGALVAPGQMPACDGDGLPGADILPEDVALVLARLPGGVP